MGLTMQNPIHSASHPVWPILRLLIVMTALSITLWLNASTFDETEIKTIITMFLIAAGAEGASSFLSQFRQPDNKDQ